MLHSADQIAELELERTLKRLPHLTEDDRHDVEDLVQNILARIVELTTTTLHTATDKKAAVDSTRKFYSQ